MKAAASRFSRWTGEWIQPWRISSFGFGLRGEADVLAGHREALDAGAGRGGRPSCGPRATRGRGSGGVAMSALWPRATASRSGRRSRGILWFSLRYRVHPGEELRLEARRAPGPARAPGARGGASSEKAGGAASGRKSPRPIQKPSRKAKAWEGRGGISRRRRPARAAAEAPARCRREGARRAEAAPPRRGLASALSSISSRRTSLPFS